jgi:hypothetical protein
VKRLGEMEQTFEFDRETFGVLFEGYSYSNLKYMRQFYLAFPHLLTAAEIGHAVSDRSIANRRTGSS